MHVGRHAYMLCRAWCRQLSFTSGLANNFPMNMLYTVIWFLAIMVPYRSRSFRVSRAVKKRSFVQTSPVEYRIMPSLSANRVPSVSSAKLIFIVSIRLSAWQDMVIHSVKFQCQDEPLCPLSSCRECLKLSSLWLRNPVLLWIPVWRWTHPACKSLVSWLYRVYQAVDVSLDWASNAMGSRDWAFWLKCTFKIHDQPVLPKICALQNLWDTV